MYKIKNLKSGKFFTQIFCDYYYWGYGVVFKTFEEAKQAQLDFHLYDSAIVGVSC